ncbi:MAG: DnaJ domain-containing protein [Gammaproteobacteria bacterium]|nr:DnaJ domain-containing protein [Gammaproteobacteria bacterium]
MPSITEIKTRIAELKETVDGVLGEYVEGISEHRLLGELRETPGMEWMQGKPADTLGLFQRHFLLFHVLYLLQQRDWQAQRAHLEISPLKIIRMPYRPGLSGLQESDPLRSYYLDLNNLETTTGDEVDSMLDNFWQRYLAGEGRQEALQALGLEEPVDRKIIEKRYRELAARHHPDRGGDTEEQTKLNKAVKILRQYYTS